MSTSTATPTGLTDYQRERVASAERDLVSGRNLALLERSARSVPLGGPSMSARSYGGAMTALARFAGSSDWAASITAPVFGRVNVYATPNEGLASIAATLGHGIHAGYFDVRAATGPESGRPSDHQHPTTLRRAILVALLVIEIEHGMGAGALGMLPGIGWTLRLLMEREGMTVDRHLFPLTYAADQRHLAEQARS